MDSARFASLLLLTLAAGCVFPLGAAQFSGQVRAADQMVPGATVTALQGGAKLTAFTDENGRYSLDLTPGVWQIEVSMFEFTTSKGQVTVSDEGIARLGVEHAEALRTRRTRRHCAGGGSATCGAGIGRGARGGQRAGGNFPRREGRGGFGGAGGGQTGTGAQGQGGPGGRGAGRGAPGQAQPGFQSAAVRATPEGQQAEAQQEPPQTADLGADADESLLLNGSMSGGLEQSSDDEARRQRAIGGRGGPGGPGGPGGRAARCRPHRAYRWAPTCRRE